MAPKPEEMRKCIPDWCEEWYGGHPCDVEDDFGEDEETIEDEEELVEDEP
jgi:hypothetical protein